MIFKYCIALVVILLQLQSVQLQGKCKFNYFTAVFNNKEYYIKTIIMIIILLFPSSLSDERMSKWGHVYCAKGIPYLCMSSWL